MNHLMLITALTLFGIAMPVSADNLSNLPANWRPTLTAVEEIDISTLEADEQQAIQVLRTDIDGLLQDAATEPKNLAHMYGKLGSQYETHGLNTSADNCFSNALRLEPDNFRWAYYLAYNAHRNGDLPVALQRLQAALALDDSYPPAISRLAQTYLDLDQLDKAQAEFSKLLDKPDFEAAGHNGLGQVLLLKHEYAQAVEHFTRALELEPDAAQIHYPLAQALRALGKNELAQTHLQQYTDQQLIIPDPLADALEALKNPSHRHFVTAMTWVMKKQYCKARSEFEAGMRADPENTAARTSYARALYLCGDSGQARIELQRVLKQDPNKHLALFLLALLEDAANNTTAAAELYHRVLDLKPDHDGAHFFLANLNLRKQRYPQAIEHYDLFIRHNTNNLPARIFRLVAMMGNGSPDSKLRDAAEQILTSVPASYPPQRIRILLLALSRDADVKDSGLATRLAEQLYKSDSNPLNIELLALSKAASGDYDSAILLMQQAETTEQKLGHRFNADRMQANLALLRSKQLPSIRWTDEIRYLSPVMANPLASFRDYPDSNPI